MVQCESDKQVVGPHHVPLPFSCPFLFFSLAYVFVYVSCSTTVKSAGEKGIPKPKSKPHDESVIHSGGRGNHFSI